MKLTITGVEDVNRVLKQIAPNHATSLARSTVQGIASDIAKESRTAAVRNSGVLKKAIKAKRKRSPPFRPRSEVYVERGKKAKNDAWYWHFVEFGTQKQSEKPFFTPVYNKYEANKNRIFANKFAIQLIKKLKRARKR